MMSWPKAKAADATRHPKIFGQVYWGNDQPAPDSIISARNEFAERYRIAQPFTNAGLGSLLDDLKVWDHIELYLVRDIVGAFVMVTSPYGDKPTACEEKLSEFGFFRSAPIYAEGAMSFIKLFGTIAELRAFLKTIMKSESETLSYSRFQLETVPDDLTVHPCFWGAVIYASPGSGKTTLSQLEHGVIDADDILVSHTKERFPDLNFDPGVHPGQILLQVCREHSRAALDDIYETATEEIEELASEGTIVLTGSVSLMHLACYVFIQTNDDLFRDGYDPSPERAAALNIGKYIPIDGYLSHVLRQDPSRTWRLPPSNAPDGLH